MYLHPKVEMNSLKGKREVAELGNNRLCVNSLGGSTAKIEDGMQIINDMLKSIIQKGTF